VKRTDPHTLAGPYALDALDERDRRRFERHLRGCDACAAEVGGLRETSARLGAATAAPAPPGLKPSVLAAARQTRQRAPVIQVRRRLVLSLAVPALAAAAVMALLLGPLRPNASAPSSPMIAAVLTADDAHMMSGQVTGGGAASVVMSHRERALVFTAAGLPGTAGYQLWLVGPTGHRLACTLAVGPHGMAGPVVATGLDPGDHLMLMAEPSGSPVLDLRL